jgi:hypothetical protein
MRGSLNIAVSAFALAVGLEFGTTKALQAQSLTYQITMHHKDVTEPIGNSTVDAKIFEVDVFKAQRANGDSIDDVLTEHNRSLLLHSRGLLVAVDTLRHNTMTFGTGKPTTIPPHPYGPNCETFAAEMSGETKTILGFKTLHVVEKPRIDMTAERTQTETHDSWVSPDLDCQALKETATTVINGALRSTSTKLATSATREPPPDRMFEVPSGYPEVPPSVFWGAMGRGFAQRQEDHYNRQKAKRAQQ